MNVDTLLKTGNISLDAILSAKIAQAKAENIVVTIKAVVPDHLAITDLELSILVGNLLDNAIEACRTAEGDRFIRIYMSMKGKMLYFLPNAPEKTALFYPRTNRSACKAHTPGTQEKGAPHTGTPCFFLCTIGRCG